jgi:hypothetical protein
MNTTPAKRSWNWNWDQVGLAVAGVAAFVLGTSIHSDRSNLAVALVGLGVLLLLIAALLPRLQSISGKVAGTEFSVSLLPPNPAVSDQVLVQPAAAGTPPGTGSQDLRGAAAPTSGFSGFGEAIKGGPATFVIINLENGRAWLSSRLYLFVQALAELRGVEAVVFTARSEDTDRFVGASSVGDVVTRLQWAFPWLAQAFGNAWATARHQPNRPPRRRLAPEDAELLYDQYVSALRQGAMQPADRAEDWQALDDGMWEHANWLDAAMIRELLGKTLSDEFVIGSLDREETLDQVVAIGTARWIAVVDEDLRVLSLVDRWKLLDRALKRVTRPTAMSGR